MLIAIAVIMFFASLIVWIEELIQKLKKKKLPPPKERKPLSIKDCYNRNTD